LFKYTGVEKILVRTYLLLQREEEGSSRVDSLPNSKRLSIRGEAQIEMPWKDGRRDLGRKVGFISFSPSVSVVGFVGLGQGHKTCCKGALLRQYYRRVGRSHSGCKMTVAGSQVDVVPQDFVFPSRLQGFESEGAYSVMVAASELEKRTGKKVVSWFSCVFEISQTPHY